MSYSGEIEDPRKPSNGTLHDFREILVILIAAVLSDCDTVEDITFWARTKEAWLRRFLVLKNGIPSEETFLRILRALDPKQFEDVFRRWVGGVVGALSGDAGLAGTIAIDGKTVRGSARWRERDPHGQRLRHRARTGARVRRRSPPRATRSPQFRSCWRPCRSRACWSAIDAMGCQREIAKRSLRRGATTCSMVKGNQPTAASEACEICLHRCSNGVDDGFDRSALVEVGHGSTVMQISSVRSPSGIEIDPERLARLQVTIGCIDSQRVVGDKVSDLERALLHQLARPHRRATGCRPCERTGPSRTGFTGSSTSASARTTA
jgi:hypothetical protein